LALIAAGKLALALLLVLGGIKGISWHLQALTGGFFHDLLKRTASSKWKGFLLGMAATTVIQSSSVITVLAVGFINGGFFSLKQGLVIMMAANVGTTITAQLFTVETKSVLIFAFFLGIFFLCLEVVTRRSFGGEVLLNIAAVLAGIKLMGTSMEPLSQTEAFQSLIEFSRNAPWKALISGAATSAVLQSSSVTIGMAVVMVKEGLMKLPEALGVIMGADLGTCVTSLIASIGTSISARRLAFGHLFFNMITILVVVPFWGYFLELVAMTSADFARQVANAHFFYNMVGVVVMLPLVDSYASLLQNTMLSRKNVSWRRIIRKT